MGNLCTGEKDVVLEGLGEEDEEQFDDLDNQKVPPPNESIAYNISRLPDQEKSQGNLTKLQEQLNTMKANERKGKKQISITRQHAPGCELKEPYIIRSLEAIYVGQWKFNSNLASSVPGGIGRLYTMNEIQEGEMVTTFNNEEMSKVDLHDDIADLMIRQNKKRAKFFLGNKDTTYHAHASDQTLRIEVVLDGQGRIFSRTKELQGTFKMGKLYGKGEMEVKYGKDVYHYKGEFVDGMKSGKGIEKFKGTTYDGQFEEDYKVGRGYLTLFISNKFEKEEEQQNQRIKADNADKNPADVIKQVNNFTNLRKNYFEKKISQLLKEKYPWQGPSLDDLKSVPFIYNSDFLLEHLRKTKFPQHYRGTFKKNQFDGNGKYTWFNGKTYDGGWVQGKMHGLGQFYWQKGGYYYFGDYEDDLKHGKGTIYWSLTKRYRGSWYHGLRHGYGELIQINKVVNAEEEQAAVEQKPTTFLGKIGNKLEDFADKIQDQLEDMGLDDEDEQVAITITGAIFNKDKIHQELWTKTERIPMYLDRVRKAEKKMECFVKGIRFNEEEFMKE